MFSLFSRLFPICISRILCGCIWMGFILELCSCQLSLPRVILKKTPTCSLKAAQEISNGTTYTVDEWPDQEWWHTFGDPQLNLLVEKALRDNPSMAAAEARIGVALAASNKSYAPFYPTIDLEIDITEVHQSKNGIFGILAASDPLYPITYLQKDLNISFAYEFDFFKKHKNELIAAINQTEAAKAEAYVSKLALSISVTQTYFQMRILKEQAKIAKKIFDNKQAMSTLIGQRQQKGLENMSLFNNSINEILETERYLSQIQEDADLSSIELQALLAGDFNVPIDDIEYCDTLEAFPLPSSLPLDLLAHRPDVWMHRWNVEAAARKIYVARVAFYPNINLTGFTGLQALNNLPLFAFDSTYGILFGPALHLPIFEGGALQANLDLSTQQYRIAVADYDSAVLTAVKEVLNALIVLQKTSERYEIAKRGETIAKKNLEQARQRQKSTLISRVDTLSFENTWLQAADMRAQVFFAYLQARIALIRALGGGYEAACAGGSAVKIRNSCL